MDTKRHSTATFDTLRNFNRICLDKSIGSEAGKILAIAEPDSAEWDNLQRQCDGHLAYYTSAPFHVKGGNATTIIEIQNAYMNNASVRHIVLHKVK